MWNLKYDTSDLTYKTDSETEKRLRVARGERAGEGRTRALGRADASARLSGEATTNVMLPAQRASQYPAINHDGKEKKRLFLNSRFLIYKTGVAIPTLKLLKGLST